MDRTVLSFVSIGIFALIAVMMLSTREPYGGRINIMLGERESTNNDNFIATKESVRQLIESKSPDGWTKYENLLDNKPSNVKLHTMGKTSEFTRPAPSSLNPNLVAEQHENFNLLQDLSADPLDDNMFKCPADSLYVAEISNCFIEDVSGLMYDVEGNIYHDPDHYFVRIEKLPEPNPAELEIRTASTYVTVIQRYSNMYYHFVSEILPRVILAKPYLDRDPEAKLLIWDTPYVRSYLEEIGVSPERIEPFDPFVRYFANRVLYPTPTPRITPCKESLELTRKALNIQTLPEKERNLIVYLSRESEVNRQVSEEEQLLESLQETFPAEKIVVFQSQKDVKEVISLFERAKMVIGPHGAGFSHIIFTAPNTKVVELSFAKNPPLMFWHISRALDLDYWIVPVPNSYWTQLELEVPVNDVLAVVSKALFGDEKESLQVGCKAGHVHNQKGECVACPAGSFKALDSEDVCVPCFPGSVSGEASSYCSVCISGSYEDQLIECKPCPSGLNTWLPGSSGVESCINEEEQNKQFANIAAEMADSGFLQKLDPRITAPVHETRVMEAIGTYNPLPPCPPLPPPPVVEEFPPPPAPVEDEAPPPPVDEVEPSPPLLSPPPFSPPPLSPPVFIFEDTIMPPFLALPFGQFGVMSSVSNLLQLEDNQFMVESMGSASLILQAMQFSLFSITTLNNDIPGNVKLSFYISIASGEPEFLALRLENLIAVDNDFEFGTPLALIDEDNDSETIPLQQWVLIEVSMGSATISPLFDSVGIFYQGPGPILYALDDIAYQELPASDMSGSEGVILDEISPLWILESGLLSFSEDEDSAEGDLVATSTIFTTNLIQLTRVYPFIAVGESPAVRFSIKAGNDFSLGQEIAVLVELSELHEEIFDSDDILESITLSDSFVEVEIPLVPGDAVAEILFSSFVSVLPVTIVIDNLRFEPL